MGKEERVRDESIGIGKDELLDSAQQRSVRLIPEARVPGKQAGEWFRRKATYVCCMLYVGKSGVSNGSARFAG